MRRWLRFAPPVLCVGLALIVTPQLRHCFRRSRPVNESDLCDRIRNPDSGLRELLVAESPEDRCNALVDACVEAYAAGEYDLAAGLARELLSKARTHCSWFRVGNAVHDGNVVLGRVALQRGDVATAEARLIEAGHAPESPTLSTFGPDVSLAYDLLKRGGSEDVVLKYFSLCRGFWGEYSHILDSWVFDVKQGKIPHFGPNAYWCTGW